MYIYIYICTYKFFSLFLLSFFFSFSNKERISFSSIRNELSRVGCNLSFDFSSHPRLFPIGEARYRKIVINDSSKITIAYRGIYLHVLQDIAIPLLELNAGSIVVFWRIYVTKRNRINCGARQIGCVNFSRAFSRPRIVPWNFAGCKYSKGHFRRTFCFHETLK